MAVVTVFLVLKIKQLNKLGYIVDLTELDAVHYGEQKIFNLAFEDDTLAHVEYNINFACIR